MEDKSTDEMEEGSSAEEATESPAEEQKEDYSSGEAKVPESFQKEAMALVQSCPTMACLDFLSSEVNEMRTKMMFSEKKSGLNTDSFSSAEMPE